MSQAKVEKYKKEKANRKKIMARQKTQRIAGLICGWAVVIAVVAWAGYSGYQWYESTRPAKTITCDTSDLDTYLDGLTSEE